MFACMHVVLLGKFLFLPIFETLAIYSYRVTGSYNSSGYDKVAVEPIVKLELYAASQLVLAVFPTKAKHAWCR